MGNHSPDVLIVQAGVDYPDTVRFCNIDIQELPAGE
jgi:hypothetical protein